MTPITVLEMALACHQVGISVIPILPADSRGDKRPAVAWKQYQQQAAAREQVETWFAEEGAYGLAACCGGVSDGLVMIELEAEGASKIADLTQAAADHDITPLWQRFMSGWLEKSPSGGFHWYVKAPGNPNGNRKLARTQTEDGKIHTLAETRENGGYSVIAPTSGRFHHSGHAWTLLAGGPHTIPTLTGEELDQILDLFRLLDEPINTPQLTGTTSISPSRPYTSSGEDTRPGSAIDQAMTWDDILTPHGWTKAHQGERGEQYWTRPGKPRGAVSASTGYKNDRDRLYVFSSNTVFTTDTPYTKFAAYAMLNHGGDMKAAALELKNHGIGDLDGGLSFDLAPTRPTTPQDEAASNVERSEHALPVAVAEKAHLRDFTEDANALLLIDTHLPDLRYITDRQKWAWWTGSTWQTQPTGGGIIRELTKAIFRQLPVENESIEKWRKRSLSSAGITNTLTLAATDARITITQNDFDQRHTELNTPGGIINLKTGELTPSDPAHLHSKTTLLTPEPTPTPMWDRFLATTFKGHEDIITYLQTLIGYQATGLVGEQILPFYYGSGANGKSVLADVLQTILGDYAGTAPANFLTSTTSQHPTELARLHGKRLIFASEVPENAIFDEVKVKQLTGGDRIAARWMHSDFFEFTPTHSLTLLGNHQPKVQAGGYSFWRRVRLIPFTNTVPEEERVDNLAQKLVDEEGAGILHWIIQGAVRYFQEGLQTPTQVREATSDYEASEDTLGRFVEDRLIIGGGEYARVKYTEMREAYVDWCKQEGINPASQNAFTRELTTRFNAGKGGSNGTRWYANVTLTQVEDEDAKDPWSDLGGGIRA